MHLQCKYCVWQGQPNLTRSGDHIKASCPECKKYIRFVARDNLDHGDMAMIEAFDREYEEKGITGGEPTLEEINFKLDLILSHLNIR